MRTRMWRRWLNLFALVSLLVGIVGSSVQAATTAARPELILSGASDLKVGTSSELSLTVANVPAETQVAITLPAGLETDVTALNQLNNANSDQFSAQLDATNLLITTYDAIPLKLAIPITAVTAGSYQLQARAGTLQSKLQVIATTESSGSAATSETEDSSSSVVVDQPSTSTQSTPDLSSSLESATAARASTAISLKADQSNGTSDFQTSFYYGGDFTLSGTVKDGLTEKLTFVLVAVSVSGNGPVLKDRTLGTVNVTAEVSQNWKYVVPDSYLPDYSDSMVGTVYKFRLEARRSTNTDSGNASFNLAYIKGMIGITAPSLINFGEDLNVKETSAITYMGKIPTGDKSLAVEDTRVFPTGVKINGWQLTATLTKQMTGQTTGTVLTDSLHYLNNGADSTLSSAAVTVASLATATPGKTTNISSKWDTKTGLAFKPKPGQPKVEKYAGTVTWTLQETLPNK